MIKGTCLQLSLSSRGQDLTSAAVVQPSGTGSYPYQQKGSGGGPHQITISMTSQHPAKHMWVLEDENMLLNTSPGISVHAWCLLERVNIIWVQSEKASKHVYTHMDKTTV